VPPLLIQPLIENAVKHGVADRVEGGVVRIEAQRKEGALVIGVENPRDPEAPPRRGQGLGLQNVRQRLQALDPQHSRVDVFSGPEHFRVRVTLPAVEAERSAAAEADPARPAAAPAAERAVSGAAGPATGRRPIERHAG